MGEFIDTTYIKSTSQYCETDLTFKVHFNKPPIVAYLESTLLSSKSPPFCLFIANLCILNNHFLFYKLILQIKFKLFKDKLKELEKF